MHRGNCSFVTKGNVAEDAGASALLIINNEKGFCFVFIISLGFF